MIGLVWISGPVGFRHALEGATGVPITPHAGDVRQMRRTVLLLEGHRELPGLAAVRLVENRLQPCPHVRSCLSGTWRKLEVIV